MSTAVGWAIALALASALLLADPARAQDAAAPVRLSLRVSSVGPGRTVAIDRGTRDAVAVGDLVLLYPRAGGMLRGAVVQVVERSATVELTDASALPEVGTKGDVLLPKTRLPATAPPAAVEPGATPPPQSPPTTWQDPDSGWREGMPLLAQVRPVRPEQRAPRLSGRFYTAGGLSGAPEDGSPLAFDNSFLRVGADVLAENPFGHGGGLRADTEIDYRTEVNDAAGFDLLVKRLSYFEGGTRFDEARWEVGRFLSAVVPEFGVLDGAEWTRRRQNGDRFGGMLGFLPELDDDFESLEDLQIAAYYEWVDPTRELSVTGALQKSWHNGRDDRDLLLLKGYLLPVAGWDLHGTLWIDLYHGHDDAKGDGVEVTQALLSAGRRWADGSGVDVSYRRQRFPEMLRHEFPPLTPAELADRRNDRVTVSAWRQWSRAHRLHGRADGWDDQSANGGALELGVDTQGVFGDGSHLDTTVFGSGAQFESVFGARLGCGLLATGGRWDAFYEWSQRHQLGFPDDVDDLMQQRLGTTYAFQTDAGTDVSIIADATVWDDDLSWSLGFQAQRRF